MSSSSLERGEGLAVAPELRRAERLGLAHGVGFVFGRRATSDDGGLIEADRTGFERRHHRRQFVATSSQLGDPAGPGRLAPESPRDPPCEREIGTDAQVVLERFGDECDRLGDETVLLPGDHRELRFDLGGACEGGLGWPFSNRCGTGVRTHENNLDRGCDTYGAGRRDGRFEVLHDRVRPPLLSLTPPAPGWRNWQTQRA